MGALSSHRFEKKKNRTKDTHFGKTRIYAKAHPAGRIFTPPTQFTSNITAMYDKSQIQAADSLGNQGLPSESGYLRGV